MEKKISRLNIDKRFSIRPVLIHVNGVSDQIKNTDFFYKIIDFSELLQTSLTNRFEEINKKRP